MQNTNTNLVSNTPSSLQKEKTGGLLPQAIKAKNVGSEYADSVTHNGIIQKIKKFLSGFFSGNILKFSKTNQETALSGILEQKPMVATMEEQAKKLASTTASTQLTKSSATATQNALRKIAEQQFMDMDVSQATRN